MTMAVCFKCGVIKFGAFCPCQECAATPATEDEVALSLAMTDHYFDRETLERIGADIRVGKPIQLDDQTRNNLITQLRSMGVLERLRDFAANAAPPPEAGKQPPANPEGETN
jgi:hypothetical protein